MQIDPFYALVPSDESEEVWHDNDRCLLAQQVPASLRRPGVGCAYQCVCCALLNRPPHPCQPPAPRIRLVQPSRLKRPYRAASPRWH